MQPNAAVEPCVTHQLADQPDIESRPRAMSRVRLSEKGRIVIPAEFREALGIKTGDMLILEVVDHELRLSTFSSRLKRAQERVKKYTTPGTSMVDELIAERREEARREEEEYQEYRKSEVKSSE
jgi:AbrB family looped-hinge helix DNA binding protein